MQLAGRPSRAACLGSPHACYPGRPGQTRADPGSASESAQAESRATPRIALALRSLHLSRGDSAAALTAAAGAAGSNGRLRWRPGAPPAGPGCAESGSGRVSRCRRGCRRRRRWGLPGWEDSEPGGHGPARHRTAARDQRRAGPEPARWAMGYATAAPSRGWLPASPSPRARRGEVRVIIRAAEKSGEETGEKGGCPSAPAQCGPGAASSEREAAAPHVDYRTPPAAGSRRAKHFAPPPIHRDPSVRHGAGGGAR